MRSSTNSQRPRRNRFWRATLGVLAIGAVAAAPVVASPAVAAPPKLTFEVATVNTTVDTGARFTYGLKVECSNITPEHCLAPTIALPVPQNAAGTVVAHSPEVARSAWVASSAMNAAGDAFVITLRDMRPGDTVQLDQSWRVDNYTVLDGEVLDMDEPTATFTGPGDASLDGDFAGSIAPVTTQAERRITAIKSMLSPAHASAVTAGQPTRYLLSVSIPAGTNGLLGLKSVQLVDTFDDHPSITREMIDVDTDAVVDMTARTITWDIVVPLDQQPIAGSAHVITREVTITYPVDMVPDAGTPGADGTYPFENRLDVTALFIDDETETRSNHVNHSFLAPTITVPGGPLHTAPGMRSMDRGALSNFTTPVKNDDTVTEWPYMIEGFWRELPTFGSYQHPDHPRNLILAHRVACYDPAGALGEGLWVSPQLSDEAIATNRNTYQNMLRDDMFDNRGDLASWIAKPDVEQCAAPGHRMTRIEAHPLVPEAGKKLTAINVAIVEEDGPGRRTHQLQLDAGDMIGQTVQVYASAGGALNLGLADDEIVSDIVFFYNGSLSCEGSRSGPSQCNDESNEASVHAMQIWGTSTQAFVDSDKTEQALWTSSFVGRLLDTVTLEVRGTHATPHAAVHRNAIDGNTPMRFNRSFTDLSVTKDTDDDVSSLSPGDVITWRVSAGLGTANGTNHITPRVVDLLPVGLEYVPGTTDFTDAPSGVSTFEPTVGTVEIGGVQRQTLTWDFAQEFQPGERVAIEFDTRVTLSAASGSHSGDASQQVYVFDNDDNLVIPDGGGRPDQYDLDGDGDTTEVAGHAQRDWTVSAVSGATVVKYVRGSQGRDLGVTEATSIGDDEWSAAGVSAATLDDSGTFVDYRLRVTNDGTRPLVETVVYDVLPYVGDTAIGGSLGSATPRESEFEVTFREILALPSNVTLEYSTSNDPTRPELGVVGGDDDWTTTLPADPSTVRALKYTITDLDPGDVVDLDFRADIPRYEFGVPHPAQTTDLSQVPGDRVAEYAWNNVAFQSSTDDEALRPAEAPKVSIRAMLGMIGDYAWFDANRNGIQDAGESPAPGVVFQLVDTDGNDVVDVNGDPVRATTDRNGFYSFEVPFGRWAVRVVEIPEGYALTIPNAGDDDARDSDAPGLGEITAYVTVDRDNPINDTLDAGIVSTRVLGDTGGQVMYGAIIAALVLMLVGTGVLALHVSRRRRQVRMRRL